MREALNYLVHFPAFIYAVSEYVSISVFASWDGATVGITSCVVALSISALTTGIKKYKAIININRKKHDDILFLAKTWVIYYRSFNF